MNLSDLIQFLSMSTQLENSLRGGLGEGVRRKMTCGLSLHNGEKKHRGC